MDNQQVELSMKEALQILDSHPEISCPADADHLDDSILLRMSGPDGLSTVLAADKHHLSLCPQCLNRWQLLLNSGSSFTDDDTAARADDWFTGGCLEACADNRLDLPMNLTSQCGRFILGVYGSGEESGTLMFTLDYCGNSEDCPEGSVITVHDRSALLLLSATLRNGRAAARLDLDKGKIPDLSSWTLRVQARGERPA